MDDYKNTKEGRIVSQKYADILHLERPEPSAKHPRMSVANRAKIFSPFAALRGFDDELAEEGAQTLRESKAELSEEEKSALSARLAGLRRGMTVTVRYFVPDLCCPADPPPGPGPDSENFAPCAGRPAQRPGAGERKSCDDPFCGDRNAAGERGGE